MPDDYRDIGAADFARFEKIRARFSNVITDFDLVTNSTPGVLQIDPVIVTYDIAPETGFFSDRELTQFSETQNIGAGSSASFNVYDLDSDAGQGTVLYWAQLNAGEEGEIDVEWVTAGDNLTLGSAAFSAPSGLANTIVGHENGNPSDRERATVLRAKVQPAQFALTINVRNTSGAAANYEVRVWYYIQPATFPFTPLE